MIEELLCGCGGEILNILSTALPLKPNKLMKNSAKKKQEFKKILALQRVKELDYRHLSIII